MGASDYIAGSALLVSVFTFYWTAIREKRAFYLVIVKGNSISISPEFALINAGHTDILVTSILCAFEKEGGNEWYVPEILSLGDIGTSFSLSSGKSLHCKVEFLGKDMNERLAEGGKFERNGSFSLYYKDMTVIVEWVNSRGKEFKAEAKIAKYGFTKDGGISMIRSLDRRHDLYKISS
ncbi:MAG: hypothetical protein O2V44_05305 [Candidatus Bathyarchaeota archaeon]|nr:hypothetical protein [Candidatus Bathyarchaeota archaeon]